MDASTAEPKPAVLAVINLPFPNSMNSHWSTAAGKNGVPMKYISEAGRKYRAAVCEQCMVQRIPKQISGVLTVVVEAWVPSLRTLDLDNYLKPLLDALKTPSKRGEMMAGVLIDDSQVRDLRIVERGVAPPGRVKVTISRFVPGAP